jgi:hypothetical protein
LDLPAGCPQHFVEEHFIIGSVFCQPERCNAAFIVANAMPDINMGEREENGTVSFY